MAEARDSILKCGDVWNFNGQESCYKFYNGSRIDLLDLKLNPSDPDYSRYGSLLYTGGWIEEAGEVHFGAFDTLKSRINRWRNREYGIPAKMLITCNPMKNWLYTDFYRPWKSGTLLPSSCFIPATYKDNKYLPVDYEENLSSIKDPIKRSRLRDGNWEYADDKSALLDYDTILDMFSNQYIFDPTEEMYMTCDPATFGGDKATIYLWQGWYIKKIWEFETCSPKQLRLKLDSKAIQHRVPRSHIVIDNAGVGAGFESEFEGSKAFIDASRPIERLEDKYKKRRQEFPENYGNLRAQSTFHSADMILKRKVGVYPEIPRRIREDLISELEQWKRKDSEKEESKVWIIPKDEMKENLAGRSPDHADNIKMRAFFDLNRSGFAFEVA